MPWPPSQRVMKPLLPSIISQVWAAMTSGMTSVISGSTATIGLPGKSKRAVK